MRDSLQGVLRRLERLATAVPPAPEGCPACRGDERPGWMFFEEIPDDAPLSKTCAACGRTYAMIYDIFCWLPPTPPPARSDRGWDEETDTTEKQ